MHFSRAEIRNRGISSSSAAVLHQGVAVLLINQIVFYAQVMIVKEEKAVSGNIWVR